MYHTKYNEYWKENVKLFTATDFIAELTQHLPPKRNHMIRYYGLYSSRGKGKSKENGRYEKFVPGKNEKTAEGIDTDVFPDKSIDDRSSGQSWARLIQKGYDVDPLECPYCGSEMKIFAVIISPMQEDYRTSYEE